MSVPRQPNRFQSDRVVNLTKMTTPKKSLLTCIRILLLVSIPCVSAADAELPAVKDLQQRLNAVEHATELADAEKHAISEQYQLAIDRLQTAERFDEEAGSYAKMLKNLPQERQRLKDELESYQPPVISDELKNAAPDMVEQRLVEAEGRVATLRSNLAQRRSALQTERELALQQLIGQVQQSIISVPTRTQPTKVPDQIQLSATIAQAAEQRLQRARLSALEKRLASRPARLALMETEVDLLTEQAAGAEVYRAALQTLLNQRREASTNSLIDQSKSLARTLASAPAALQQLASRNIDMARSLAQLSPSQQQTEAQLARFQTDVAELDEKIQSLDRLLELQQFQSSAGFGAALREEWDRASETINIDTIKHVAEQQLTSSRIALFHLDRRRAPFDLPTEDALRAQLGSAASKWTDAIQKLVEQRRRLMTIFGSAQTRHVDELSALLNQLEYFSTQSLAYSQLLESHLFWIPSAQAISLKTLSNAGKSLDWIFAASHWRQVADTVRQNLSTRLLRLSGGLLLLVVAMRIRKPLKERLANMVTSVHKVQSDRFSLTVIAFAISALLALPPALVFFGAADLSSGGRGFASSFSIALLRGGWVLFLMEFMRQLTRPRSVAEVHFRWSDSTLGLLRHNNRWLIAIFVPIFTIMTLLDVQATAETRDGLGRIALLVLCISMALFVGRLTSKSRISLAAASGKTWRWYAAYLGYPLLTVVPLALMLLSLLGFHYTAVQLMQLTLQTVVAVTVAILVYFTLERAFSVYERRLTLERLLAKRAEASAKSADRDVAERAGEGIPEIIESHEIDRQTITSQTKTLIRLIVWLGLLFSIASIWRDLLPVARSFEAFVLWQVTSNDSTLAPQVITVWSLMVAVAVLVISIVAVKNLPGALEIALLSRLSLAPGSGYAITTVLKYIIVLFGLLTAANLLGADWSKLQWLIAALGVGLGFGLQEIVANFISGIVLLFEKPFRLGDIVTIAENTGTVTRIRTRATTISDWDRKELIIPNKKFATEAFTNWTLSDPITRLVIPIGVDYGTDTEMVVSLLLEAARRHEQVSDDPAPAALFIGFGDNSLNFELRVFAPTVLDKLIMGHDLNMAIDATFRKNGIGISYPQRDVHLSSVSPIEMVIKRPAPDRD